MHAQAWTTLIVGVLAVMGVIVTVGQRTRADNRAQSWNRITWCLERTVSDDFDEVELGWDLYGTVAAIPFIVRTDRDTLRAISNHAARTAVAERHQPGDTELHNQEEGQR